MQLNNLLEVRDFDIEECINHLEMLHKDSKGYITISSKTQTINSGTIRVKIF